MTEGIPYGLAAEFDDGERVLEATRRAHEAGYRRMDAYTPYPVEGLAELVGMRKTRIPLLVLLGGVAGAVAGYGLQYWVSAVNYPVNVGGKPYHSAPMFIPVTFEVTILLAAFAGVIGMIVLNGLPEPYHPMFNVERFSRASQDRFFLCIESADPQFELARTREFLQDLGPSAVHVVEP